MQQNYAGIVIPLGIIALLLPLLWRIGLRTLKKYPSKLLGTIEVVQKYNGEKLLTINGYAQGISTEKESIKKSYWYCVAIEVTKFCQSRKTPQLLMFGLGANTISNLLAKDNPEIRQTIVEFDPQIIQACRDYFDLDKLPNHTIILADAYKLVNEPQNFNQKYDVIIIDIYVGRPPFVSLRSNQPTFIQKVLPLLKKDGLIIFNRPGHTEEARTDSHKLEDYLKTLFKEVNFFDIKDPRGYRNNVISASELSR